MADRAFSVDPLRIGAVRDETYLGFDYGAKSIGVAIGQRVTGTATALDRIRAASNILKWEAIERLVKAWSPSGFVVGLAYQPDGRENPITQPTLKFCRQLEGRFVLPVYTMDEMLSTVESRHLFYSDRTKKSADFLDFKDSIAAQLILQSWLTQSQVVSSHA
jgi:putative Holliday junction resolvase